MTRIIGLSSFNLFEQPKYISVADQDYSFETLFLIDRVIRGVVGASVTADWGQLEPALKAEGFVFIQEPSGGVFWHPRYWNEQTTPSARSFFVEFPDSAPYELAGEIILATNYPGFFAPVPDEYFSSQKLLLLNANHEPIYPSDLAWDSDEQNSQLELGPVKVIKRQFATEDQYLAAKFFLADSGYLVCEAA